MTPNKTLRGFRVLRRAKGNGFSLKLFVQNNERFIVVFTRKLWGFRLFKKSYSYPTQGMAHAMFDKLLYAKMGEVVASAA